MSFIGSENRSLKCVHPLSIAVLLLTAAASLAGLFFPETLYPSEELRRSLFSNDIVNLLIGLPLLWRAQVLSRRGRLIGLLFWPGALFYVSYNSIAYTFALPMGWPRLLYLSLSVLSIWTIFRLLGRIDGNAIRSRLAGSVPVRLGGTVLAGFGVLFFLRSGFMIVNHLAGNGQLPVSESAVLAADLLITPVWVLAGIALWRRKVFGYVVGTGLLFQACMLFVALLVYFVLQPLTSGEPFPLEDFITIFVMSLICFVPFGLFMRGAGKKNYLEREK
jgi:hypothetical protein